MSNSTKEPSWRLLNADGSFNITRTKSLHRYSDLYHTLLTLTWPQFFAAVLTVYILMNTFFAAVYYFCGVNALFGIQTHSEWARFIDCFFFSVQTSATIGYGRIGPNTLFANVVVAVEALVGLMELALMTGLSFARFSRPTSRVLFSDKAVIMKIDGVPSLCFRIANQRANQIVEARVVVSVAKFENTHEGERYRNFYDLTLERSFSPMFVMSWLIVHPITADSPLRNMTHDSLEDCQAEFFVTLSGTDETFSQTVHARHSYVPQDIVWNARFKDMLKRTKHGKIHVNLEEIHAIDSNPQPF